MTSWQFLTEAAFSVPSATLGGGGTLPIDPVRILAGLAAGLILSLLAALLVTRMKRSPRGAPGWMSRILRSGEGAAQIRIVETRRASVHADICLVNWDGRNYLLAITPGGASVIDARVEREAPAAETTS